MLFGIFSLLIIFCVSDRDMSKSVQRFASNRNLMEKRCDLNILRKLCGNLRKFEEFEESGEKKFVTEKKKWYSP